MMFTLRYYPEVFITLHREKSLYNYEILHLDNFFTVKQILWSLA